MRISSQGDSGVKGGPPGDLYVRLRVSGHELFERIDNNVLLEVPVTFSDAALGAQLEVPTLEGAESLSVKAGTQAGEIIRMKRKGLPALEGGARGDQLVKVVVETPRKLSSEARGLFEQIRELNHENEHPARQGFLDRIRDYFKGKSNGSEDPGDGK